MSAVLREGGSVAVSYAYDPWGGESQAMESVPGIGSRFELPHYGYNAEEASPATGSQYLRARWYDPSMGAFGSRDAYLGDASAPSTLNRYAYAEGNPVALSDPTGHVTFRKSSSSSYFKNVYTSNSPTSRLQRSIVESNGQKALYKSNPMYIYKRSGNILPRDPRPLYNKVVQGSSSSSSSSSGSGSGSGGGYGSSGAGAGKSRGGGNSRASNSRTSYNSASAARANRYATAARAAFCGTAAVMGSASSGPDIDWAAIGHGALDLLGFIPGIGTAADVANGLWYAAEGNYVDAAASFISAVPGVGDAFGGANAARKAAKAGLTAIGSANDAAKVGKTIRSNKAGTLRAVEMPDGTVDLVLKRKDTWDDLQFNQALQKAQDISRADTKKVTPEKRKGSASKQYKDAYGKDSVPDGYDVDHVIDLQLGGADNVDNMRPLDKSVNRSMGAQISYLIRELDDGTRIGNIRFE